MSERSEISLHETKVYAAFCKYPDKWMSSKEVATLITGVAARTVRLHTSRLVNIGILDQAELFPEHRFRLSAKANKRDNGYLNRLKKAIEIFASSDLSP